LVEGVIYRLALLLFCLLLLIGQGATAQTTDPLHITYLEGRITEIDFVSRIAQIKLRGSDTLSARVPDYDLVPNAPVFKVGDTLVGSIGLILAVPFTTLIAALMFRGTKLSITRQELQKVHH
jgi:hypothetical protein